MTVADPQGGPVRDPIRSYAPITRADLRTLTRIALRERQAFFTGDPRCAVLAETLLCSALCRVAALHALDGSTGIKDFDVWFLFGALPGIGFPHR